MIGSMSGKKGDPGAAAYNASKFGLQGFSQALTYEVRKHNIRVMVLNPSSVNTGPDSGPEHGKGLYLHAADIASTVAQLAMLPGRTQMSDMDVWETDPTWGRSRRLWRSPQNTDGIYLRVPPTQVLLTHLGSDPDRPSSDPDCLLSPQTPQRRCPPNYLPCS